MSPVQRNRHNDQLRAFQRFLLLHQRTSGLASVSFYDIVDQFIDSARLISRAVLTATGVERTLFPVPDRHG